MDIKDATDDQLREELEGRRSPAPTPLAKPDFSRLIEFITNGVETMVKKEHEDDDFDHLVYEQAMTAVYGPGFFQWRNKQDW